MKILTINPHKPNVMASWSAFLLVIWESLVSKLYLKACYPDRFTVFFNPLQTNAGTVL
jgi:hypothetical protein